MVERKKIGGKEYTVVNDPRYKIPIALPTGIYNILAEISNNSITTYKEREEASKKYYVALENAAAKEKSLSPEERLEKQKARERDIEEAQDRDDR